MDSTSSVSSHDVISSDRVAGTAVYNGSGERLGTIDHLVIDKVSGQVRYAVMEFGGFLGLGTDRYPVPWKVLRYDPGQGGYVVPLDRATLEGAPKFAHGTAPDYGADYDRSVTTYYGYGGRELPP